MTTPHKQTAEKVVETDVKYISFNEAVSMLPDGDTIHTFRNPNAGMLIGCDLGRKDIVDMIQKYGAELSGKVATAMDHGIAINENGRWCFVETKKVNL